jgi:hypothetical protein
MLTLNDEVQDDDAVVEVVMMTMMTTTANLQSHHPYFHLVS